MKPGPRPYARRALIVALAACVLAATAAAADLERGPVAAVRDIVDGDTLVLEDGKQVRLVGIQAPKLPLGRPGFRPWPLADEAKKALSALVLGRRVTLSFGGRRVDRNGRLLAHLHYEAGGWIQGQLLRQGLARVYSFADNRALVPEMLRLEREARAAGRGIWNEPFYRVRRVKETHRLIARFELVEGRVRAVAVVRGRGYLNFGSDWRTDFTVSVAPKARRLFAAAGLRLDSYEGRRVRVRGWLKRRNGPMIDVSHPEQIEILEE